MNSTLCLRFLSRSSTESGGVEGGKRKEEFTGEERRVWRMSAWRRASRRAWKTDNNSHENVCSTKFHGGCGLRTELE